MQIVRCPCGKQLRINQEHIGKRIQCRACGEVLLVEDRLDSHPAPGHSDEKRQEWWTGILDMFRPKWKNSDWHVRLRALEALQKQSVVSNLASADPNGDVRRAAHARLQQLLAARAEGTEDYVCGEDAVSELEDLGLLAHVARNATNRFVRLAAARKTGDQALLVGMAYGDPDAVEMLDDQRILADLAKYGEDDSVRTAAMKRLKDERLLADAAIAALAKHHEISIMAAADYMKDPRLLGEVAVRAQDEALRFLVRIDDAAIVQWVAENALTVPARKAAEVRLDELAQLEALRTAPQDFETLVKALVSIASYANSSLRGFLKQEQLTRAIGYRLNSLGGMPMMLKAHDAVRSMRGRVVGRELEVAWDGIGQWQG
ncbi:MAG TPA: hypothetical protein VM223_10520 [Planctomycetota bacterium]|nr:hypothetical protein [Planctomycetota bacterium]